MVSYKENPKLDLQIVTTINGDREYRKNCKFIKEKYYTINHDCFEIDGKWYRTDNENIVHDWEKQVYVIRKKTYLLKGLIRNKEGELEIGYFSPNPYNNIMSVSKKFGTIEAVSEEALGKDWFEDMRYHQWFYSKDMDSGIIATRKKIQNHDNPAARGYNIEDNKEDYRNKINLYNKYNTVITPKIKALSKYLENLSFGFEFELCVGNLPYHLQNRYGVVLCRDGSLNGGAELASIPMSGAKGLQTIVNLCDDLKPRGEINLDCSLHIHFGNIGTDKLSIIALYRLCRNLQEEIFTMFPYYKTVPDGIKQKNYTKKLHKLNIGVLKDISKDAYEAYLVDSWNKLFNFYADKSITIDEFNKETREHPIHNKWSRNSRYYFFNMLNLFFTHRHTLEARISGPTTNKDKAINWMLICVSIIRYSERYAKDIITKDKTISLKEVLDIFPLIYPNDKNAYFLSKYLYNYFVERQIRCKKDMEKGDYKSMWDITEDKEYKYQYLGINLLE